MPNIKLYNYFRSSTSYRARIALELKNIPYDYIIVHLVNNGGEQNAASYEALNPMREVPTLVDEKNNVTVAQSMAVIEYLDEAYPTPKLFTHDLKKRALIRQFCENVNSGLHPLQNLKVTQYLTNTLKLSEEQKQHWLNEWMHRGLKSLETMLEKNSGTYCFGNEITAADTFLVPQIFSAKRMNVDVTHYPLIQKINDTCVKLEAFEKAHPKNQPDFSA